MGSRKVEDGGGSSSSTDSPFATLEPSEDEAEEEASKKRKRLATSSALFASTSLSWIPQALESMQVATLLVNNREELRAHPSPHSCLPDLRLVRGAAMALVHGTDDAIEFVEKKILRQQVLPLEGELVRQKELLQEARAQSAHYSKLLVNARRRSNKLGALLQQALRNRAHLLVLSHELERETILREQKALQKMTEQ